VYKNGAKSVRNANDCEDGGGSVVRVVSAMCIRMVQRVLEMRMIAKMALGVF
jgi:hypothetical protein